MNLQVFGRIIAILVGGVVLFGLELWFLSPMYVAIPAAIVTYSIVRFAFALLAPPPGQP